MHGFEKLDQLVELYKKHVSGELSGTEKVLLDAMLVELPHVKRVFDEALNEEMFLQQVFDYYRQAEEISDDHLQRQFDKSLVPGGCVPIKGGKKTSLYKWVAAASVAILLGLGGYFAFYSSRSDQYRVTKTSEPSSDVAPGSYRAKLTLSDGTVIVLDSASGELAKQGNVVVKNESGRLVYDEQGNNTEVLYNTLTTSTGESYSTILADGSRIWLNSGSSVKFPVAFTGDERVIVVSGEVFLEVAKDKKLPFKVQVLQDAVKKCEIQVLGTSFNVMAYSDELQIETTLIEGKVSFNSGNVKKILMPGQQIALNSAGDIEVSNDINTDMITAWKNQDFYFKSNDLRTIMRHLTRWYGIQVEFEGKISDEGFTGQINRNKSLSEVLKVIEQSGIKFKIEGKKVTVNSN